MNHQNTINHLIKMTGNTNQTQPSTQRKPDSKLSTAISIDYCQRWHQKHGACTSIFIFQTLLCPAKAIDDLVTSTPHLIQPHCPAAGLHQRLWITITLLLSVIYADGMLAEHKKIGSAYSWEFKKYVFRIHPEALHHGIDVHLVINVSLLFVS